jgi:hypothetical protein
MNLVLFKLTSTELKHLRFSADKEGMERSMDITSYATAVKREHHTKFSSSEKFEEVNFDLLDADFLNSELDDIYDR